MKKFLIFLSLVTFIFSACDRLPEVECQEPESQIIEPSFEFVIASDSLMYSELRPEVDFDCFEIRHFESDGLVHEIVKYTYSKKCAMGGNPSACLEKINNVAFDERGFAENCPLRHCGDYILTLENGELVTYANVAELKSFLGSIDSRGDALLLVFGMGYYNSAIKDIENGYQIKATKLVLYCDPVQTDQFLLEISREGEIKILEQEVLERIEGICI